MVISNSVVFWHGISMKIDSNIFLEVLYSYKSFVFWFTHHDIDVLLILFFVTFITNIL